MTTENTSDTKVYGWLCADITQKLPSEQSPSERNRWWCRGTSPYSAKPEEVDLYRPTLRFRLKHGGRTKQTAERDSSL